MAEKESGLDQFPDAMPRPWTAEVGERLSLGGGDCWVIDSEIGSVAEMQCGIDREGQTAKLIVAAVNAYDSRRSDAEQLSELRRTSIEACLKELREALPLGRIEIHADMTESGQIHVTILNAFLDAVPYGPTLGDAMNKARAVLTPKQLGKETQGK